jgi:hypothetical protein
MASGYSNFFQNEYQTLLTAKKQIAIKNRLEENKENININE